MYGKLTCNGKNQLGVETESLNVFYQEGIMKQMEKIMKDVSCPPYHCHVYLMSGRRPIICSKYRYRKSFVQNSILLLTIRNEMIMILCDYEHKIVFLLNVIIVIDSV